MATPQANVPANSTSEKTKVTHVIKADGGLASARPTVGQLWPRIKRNG